MGLTKNSRQDLLNKISKLGIEIVDVKGDEACCRCPKHDDSSPSFFFNLDTEAYHCFAGCIKGRGIHQLIAAVTGVSQQGEIIQELLPSRVLKDFERNKKIIPSIPNLPLAINNKGQDYLVGRGFYPKTISDWEIRYWNEEDAVVIPIEDKGYALRFLDKNRKPKYKYITGTRISETLFGLNKLPKTLTNIILVEGSLDCIYMHQLGFTNTVALLHADISLKQLKILGGITDYVYIMLDGDKAGRDASEKIKVLLNHRFIKKICYLPDGKDPDNLKKEEIEKILKEAK